MQSVSQPLENDWKFDLAAPVLSFVQYNKNNTVLCVRVYQAIIQSDNEEFETIKPIIVNTT